MGAGSGDAVCSHHIVHVEAKGNLVFQQYLDTEGVSPLLHGLEGISGHNEIGATAENMLDILRTKKE